MRILLVAAVAALLVAAPAEAALTILDVDTGKRTTVAPDVTEGWTSISWTPDGSALIAVENDDLDLSVRRYPVTGSGGKGRLLRRLPEALDAVLSPDGRSVAALYDHGLKGTGGVIVRDIASGSAGAKLPQTAEGDDLYESSLQLAWSRDGKRVTYEAFEGRRGETLRVADARTGRVLRRLGPKHHGSVSGEPFSPTGDRLVYTTGSRDRLMVLDIASGATRRLAGVGIWATWAPVGERIAASTWDEVTVSGEDQRFGRPTALGERVEGLLWSPDGSRLAIPLSRDFKSALAVLAPGGTPRILVPFSDKGTWGLTWSPDGRRLAYFR